MEALRAELSRKKNELGSERKTWRKPKPELLSSSSLPVEPVLERTHDEATAVPLPSSSEPLTESGNTNTTGKKREREETHLESSLGSESSRVVPPDIHHLAEAAVVGGGSVNAKEEEREEERPPARRRKGSSHLEAVPYAPSKPGGDAHKYLYKFWKGLLSEWEEQLEGRPREVALSPQGRAELESAQQTAEFMAPFFSLCKSRTVPPDMLPLCVEFVDLMLLKEYMAAGDAYVRLSIGKAQWLMGVSQVGLHERAARERIYIGKLPHVLNDETQRRYLTSMKKLMSVLQKMCPPSIPSKAYMP